MSKITLAQREENLNQKICKQSRKKCRGVKKEAGTDPTALIIVPPNKDIHCFTPIQQMQETTTDEFPTTHFDYHTLYTSLLKIDILGHPALDMLKILEDSTKFPLSSVPFDDESTLSLFRPAESRSIPAHLESPNFITGEFDKYFAKRNQPVLATL